MFICLFLGIRIGAVVLVEMGYASDLLRHLDFILFFVASVMGARLRDFGWSAFWGWAGIAVVSFAIPIGVIQIFKPEILPTGELTGSARSYTTLFSTLPFFALIVAIGLPPSDPNSKYGKPSRYNMVVSESTLQFAERWILRPLSIFRRRVNRSAYRVGLVIAVAILIARSVAENNNNGETLWGLPLFMLAVVIAALLVAARLRDFGWSGLWGWGAIIGLSLVVPIAVFSLVQASRIATLPFYVTLGPPFLCLVIILVVGIPRGSPGVNKYGPPFRWRQNKTAA